MNERIRQLYYECQDESQSTEQCYQKFAELIVQECAGVCAGIAAVRAGYNDVDGRDTAYSCGDTIKEYFGVE
jgi:hypothetical protein